jgi:pimeloyl-ACP methyl ester carboxylesterase
VAVVAKRMTIKMLARVTGKGVPLVLVPGGLTGWLDWKQHANRLAAARKVIRVQLLNVQYGLEKRSLPLDYSVKTESRALAATLDELALNEAIDIVAWSYGALVTLDYALDNPSRVRSLILIEPPAFWVLHASGKLDAKAEQNGVMPRASRDGVSEDQLEQFLYAVGLCSASQSARNLPQWPLWVQYRQSLRNTFVVLKHNDDPKRLSSFQRPVLLLKGTDSIWSLHQIIDVLAIQLPQAQVMEMPSGHAPQIASIDRFLKQMKAFQASVHD